MENANRQIRVKTLRRLVVVLAGALVVALAGSWVSASNMGFKLNIRAINTLFRPSGYEADGTWSGEGSGVRFDLDWSGEDADVAHLHMQTPAGTISLPYTDPAIRYTGTGYFNYAVEPPLEFVSADGAASISVYSKWEGDPMVRFTGTGLCVTTPGGPVSISVAADRIEVKVADEFKAWNLVEGNWVGQ